MGEELPRLQQVCDDQIENDKNVVEDDVCILFYKICFIPITDSLNFLFLIYRKQWRKEVLDGG